MHMPIRWGIKGGCKSVSVEKDHPTAVAPSNLVASEPVIHPSICTPGEEIGDAARCRILVGQVTYFDK